MRGGRIVQTGAPAELYDAPLNRYVADFVGKTNFFDGTLDSVEGPTGTVAAGPRRLAGRMTGGRQGDAVSLSLRPEQIALTRAPAAEIDLPVQVINRIFLGEHTEYLVRNADLGEFLVLVSRQAEAANGSYRPGDSAHAGWKADAALILQNS